MYLDMHVHNPQTIKHWTPSVDGSLPVQLMPLYEETFLYDTLTLLHLRLLHSTQLTVAVRLYLPFLTQSSTASRTPETFSSAMAKPI